LCLVTNAKTKDLILYSLLKIKKDEAKEEECGYENISPHISIISIEKEYCCHTLKVTCKVYKWSLYIIVDSGSTHNFSSPRMANKL
jgi:hypothetical protein